MSTAEPIPEEFKTNTNEWISLSEDGGVKKKILVPGIGDDTPPEGANVICHYVGTLVSDGSKFDSSRDRDSPFNFPIGKGKVIKGWDIGIASMKKQEKSILRCRYDYAYGESGSGSIPPSSDLDFEVELIDWDEWTDVKGNGCLMRRKIKTTEDDYNNPQEYAKCKVTYSGKILETGIEFTKGENEIITLGDDDRFPQGFHDALLEMCSGEQSEFKVMPSLAYGTKGNEALKVSPSATILYTITLHSFENPPELWDMSTEAHFSEAEKFKNEGNDAFRSGQYQRAIKKYEHALKIIKDDGNFNDDEKKNAKAIVAAISSNLALVYFKQQEYGECLTKVNEILNDDPKNLKALVRRGQAHMMMGNNDLAKEDFKQALEVDPNNQDVKKLIAANKKRIQEHKNKERQLYGNMFASKPKPKKDKPQKPSETTESKEKEEATTAESS